ncbi:trypsin-like peptidase domain-containing protein [Streptomyces luteireticuli]|uniref:trypsin-like peptidase domain-containing protein n=1 Tax=Streptomyces luteireticuli TaxID=173858 RepID=UPI0035587884
MSAQNQLTSALLRVRISSVRTPSPVGVAVLVGGRTALTCAHVVNCALGRAKTAQEPPTADDVISLDMPLLTTGEGHCRALRAVVSDQGWFPLQDDQRGDLAVLHLLDAPPPQASPVLIHRARDLWGHPCRVYGYSMRDGAWASGIMRDRQDAGLLQIEFARPDGILVAEGFSGSPVWDEQEQAVVGLTTAALAPARRTAYLLPGDEIAQLWPDLPEHVPTELPQRALLPLDASDTPKSRLRMGRLSKRMRWILLAAAVAVFCACGLLVLHLSQVSDQSRAPGATRPTTTTAAGIRFNPVTSGVPHCATFTGTGVIPEGFDVAIFDTDVEANGEAAPDALINFDGNAVPTSDGHGWVASEKTIGSGSGDAGERALIMAVLMPHEEYNLLRQQAPHAKPYWGAMKRLPDSPQVRVVDQIVVTRNDSNAPCPGQ